MMSWRTPKCEVLIIISVIGNAAAADASLTMASWSQEARGRLRCARCLGTAKQKCKDARLLPERTCYSDHL
ncbi:hypothetical protein EV421DRAFT_1783126 [Armillaria borealis]|uniref:Secreted protein n=1 Tax=Armillaria borealis TaxID=47425 RepID=A0AA39MWF8_9AGAR|nr:hypothetical protein EV421DRAFT_1783126 [Armillaria borealis]